MKILIYGNASLVDSVSVTETEIGLGVLINKSDRGAGYHRAGITLPAFVEEFKDQPPLDFENYRIYSSEYSDDLDYGVNNLENLVCDIIVIAENENEKALFWGDKGTSVYDQQNKDQIEFQYINNGLLLGSKEIASLDVNHDKYNVNSLPGTYGLDKNAIIILPHNSLESRKFIGRIINVVEDRIVQDIGHNSFVIHDQSRVGDVKNGSFLNIQYRGKAAKVTEINNQKINSFER